MLAGKPRPAARVDAWKRATGQRDTATVLEHYALLPRVDDAIASKNLREARHLANIAASGVTANDALPLYYLQRVASVPDLARRHARAPERSWKFELWLASNLAQRDRASARALVEEQFNYFHKAPPAWPDVIAFYRDHGFVEQAKSMAQDCLLAMPSYRAACIASAKTESERAAERAAAEREAKRLADKIIKAK